MNLDPHHIGIRRKAQDGFPIVEPALHIAVGQPGAWTCGVGVQHMYFSLISQRVLNEHPPELTTSQKRDTAWSFHAAKISGGSSARLIWHLHQPRLRPRWNCMKR